jgi:hypothetical protein
MNGITNWLQIKLIRWGSWSPEQKFRAVANAGVDAVLIIFFLGAVWVGLTADFNEFFFWVPLSGAAIYFRFKQMRQRWAL